MSAVGNRFFAAPEVQRRVRDIKLSEHGKPKNTLSNFVSDYGMVADAFSVGATIRYILTGVSPMENIDDVIWAQQNPVTKASRWIGKKLSKSKETKKRTKTFRKIKECPREAVKLVLGMTHGDQLQRTTVRAARMCPWIDEVLESTENPALSEMKFLKCATKDCEGIGF
jgi:nicotinic acid phosphoribosyltransferase